MSSFLAIVSTTLVTIRNGINPLDQAFAGAVMGSVARFNFGPKGWISGGTVGAALGGFAGLYMWLKLYLSGITVEERWREEFKAMRKKQELKDEERRQEQDQRVQNKSSRKWLAGEEEDQQGSTESSTSSAVTETLWKARNMIVGNSKD